MRWPDDLQPGLHLLLREGMRFKAARDFVSMNYASAIGPVAFVSGITYTLRHLSPHNSPPEGERPTEENTMAGWVIEGGRAVHGMKQSSRQILLAVLDGWLVPLP